MAVGESEPHIKRDADSHYIKEYSDYGQKKGLGRGSLCSFPGWRLCLLFKCTEAKDTGHAVAAILTARTVLKILLVAFFMFCFSSFFWKHLIYPVLCLCSQYRKNNMFFKEAVFDFTLHFLISALYTAME